MSWRFEIKAQKELDLKKKSWNQDYIVNPLGAP